VAARAKTAEIVNCIVTVDLDLNERRLGVQD
jgi:hypothetical protein